MLQRPIGVTNRLLQIVGVRFDHYDLRMLSLACTGAILGVSMDVLQAFILGGVGGLKGACVALSECAVGAFWWS